MKFLKRILNSITNLFSKSHPEPIKVDPPEVKQPVKPAEPLPPVEDQRIDWHDWVQKALAIVSRFEGSDPWANITGNFDGAGLTCGALGWTILYGDQQTLVKRFVSRHGLDRLKGLMPVTGNDYWSLIQMTDLKSAVRKAGGWSNGANVIEPYKRELRSFWKSPEMVEIQIENAEARFGKFAKEMTLKVQAYLGFDFPSFGCFAYWFDQCVLNGEGKLVAFADADKITTDYVLNWANKETGYGEKDLRKNVILWRDLLKSSPREEVFLFKLACLRAQKSRAEFDTDVMCRRGALALGQGFVHGELYTFDWK